MVSVGACSGIVVPVAAGAACPAELPRFQPVMPRNVTPVGNESAAEMLTALLGDGKDLPPLKRLIIERTQGTPFFMEEIVQALFEDGVLQRNGAVKLARSMNAVKVPATVQAVLASRIDRLSAEGKELLQTWRCWDENFRSGWCAA